MEGVRRRRHLGAHATCTKGGSGCITSLAFLVFYVYGCMVNDKVMYAFGIVNI